MREAARFDRRAISVPAGLLAAIPVAVVLTLGTVVWSAVAGVTMGAGAMLVGTAWRIAAPGRPGRPPLGLLATDAALMSLATFLGAVTGSVTWLHLGLLFVGALLAGLLVSLGPRGGVIGTQAVIAAVVFGRFSQPAGASAGLAGLVLAGGLAQVLFLAVVRWPMPLRGQRGATAAAYRVLSGLANATPETSTLPAAAALDEAQAGLSSPTLFGDPAMMNLRSLVSEGLRMRVQLTAIHALIAREPSGADDPPRTGAQRILTRTGAVLELIARAIEADREAAAALPAEVKELSAQVDALQLGHEASEQALERRLTALAGQLRAAAALAISAGEGGSLRDRRPQRPANRPGERIRADLAVLRANASLQSPAGRHAVRLAVVVLAAELISRHLPLQRGYWMVVAAATTLRPEFGATFTRGAERALGTALGVALAGAIAITVHPSGAATIVIVGVLAWAGYAVFPASFAVGFAFITALVVFLLNAISPDTLATAWARLLDTLVGGGIGLIVYALWPTWSRAPARQALADLIDAQRAYLAAVLGALITGRRPDEARVRTLSQRARLTRTAAESTVARSLSEPATRRIDAEASQGTLAALRRLVQAAHVLRLEVQDDGAREPMPALEPLASGLEELLCAVQDVLRSRPEERPPAREQPDLRARYRALERSARDDVDESVLAELDEIVDAANTVAELVGLEPAAEPAAPEQAVRQARA